MADDIVETITITTEGQDEAVQAFTDIGKASDDLAKKLGELGGADFGGIAEALQVSTSQGSPSPCRKRLTG